MLLIQFVFTDDTGNFIDNLYFLGESEFVKYIKTNSPTPRNNFSRSAILTSVSILRYFYDTAIHPN